MCHLAFGDSPNVNGSLELISRVAGVSEHNLREDYAIAYNWRSDVLHEDMLEHVGYIDIKRALQAVPPLAWPAF